MNTAGITLKTAVATLEAAGMQFTTEELGKDARVVVLLHGGRVLGPFIGDGESLLWVNPLLADAAGMRAFTEEGNWNTGGERVYIGPELRYSVPDRSDFWNSYTLSPAVDPGNYAFVDEHKGPGCIVWQEMQLHAYDTQTTRRLRLVRWVRPAADPLRTLRNHQELVGGVDYCGYSHSLILDDLSTDAPSAHTWDLLQVHTGGTILLPCTPDIEFTNYYDPPDARNHEMDPGHVRIDVPGRRRFKTGYRAVGTFGRVGYLREWGAGALLIVRNFPNDPSADYDDEPYDKPRQRGDSFQVYQDDGELGAFAELECMGRALGGRTGRERNEDILTTWFYTGPRDRLAIIARHLLGTEVE